MAVDFAAASKVTDACQALDEETGRAVVISMVAGALAGAVEADALADFLLEYLRLEGLLIMTIDSKGIRLRTCFSPDRISPKRASVIDRMLKRANQELAHVVDDTLERMDEIQ